ncbi:hypothetical protein ACOMHN_034587 [Nucella lapillus]
MKAVQSHVSYHGKATAASLGGSCTKACPYQHLPTHKWTPTPTPVNLALSWSPRSTTPANPALSWSPFLPTLNWSPTPANPAPNWSPHLSTQPSTGAHTCQPSPQL